MSWMLSFWVATALLALCGGTDTMHEGNSLSASGYHLCMHNKTRNVSVLVMHTVPYTVIKPCGGWLLWKTCTDTLYRTIHQTEYKTMMEQVTGCCTGYVQVGHYCALPVSRSVEFTAKPGSCPSADGFFPRSEDCEWDMDCPGWQKCCQRSGRSVCSDPASSTNHSENGGSRFNATVTVKTDYDELMSNERGHLDHTRLLQAMVTGALQSDVSVYYLSSQPVHPYRTATSLLIDCNNTLSLYNVTSKLHHLLKHILEVSSVTVEDVDECELSALRRCSTQAHCNNTVGSYHCACHQGYIDVDPNNPGAHCTADIRMATTPEPPLTYLPPINTSYTTAFNSTQDPVGNRTMGVFNSTETSMTTALSNTSPVPHSSTDAPQWTGPAPHSSASTTVESLLPTTTCSPPIITSVWSANVTGTSFCVYWSSQFQTNQTYQVVLSKRSEVIHSCKTNQTMMELRGLQPGVLYNVTVTPQSCGSQGVALRIMVKTDAQTLDATVRLTNIQFTADLQNTSSQAYQILTKNITEEIYKSLSPEIKAMVDSGQVRIEIRRFSPGSVVVNFTIIFSPSQSQDISNVSTALLHSLTNSTIYTVDQNNTRTHDFDECASGENDCSQWATCRNILGSYTCVCLERSIDNNPGRPGRDCQAIASISTAPTTTSSLPATSSTAPIPTAPTTINTVPTTTTANSTTSFTAPTPTAPTTTNTVPTTTTTTHTSSTAPTTTNTVPTTTTTTHTSSTAQTTTNAVPTTTTATHTYSTASTTTNTAPTTITATDTTSSTAPATTAPTNTTTTSTPSSTAPTTTTTIMISMTTTPTTTATVPSTNITSPATTAAALRTATNAISVQCRVAAITVTVARDFLLRNKIRVDTIYLGLPECGVNGGNATHAQLTVAWNECLTRIVQNDTYCSASVTLFNTMEMFTLSTNGTEEVPRIRLEVPIMCAFTKNMLISVDSGSMGYDMIKDVITGLGSFQVTVQLMNGTMPLPYNSSLSSEEAVVLEVSLRPSSEQIKVVINRCWATPTRNPADPDSHTFLANSCSLNTYTKVLMNGNSSTSRVSVQIFRIVNLNVIYLHCEVQICVPIKGYTCVPDCLQRTARSSNIIGRASGSSGPLLRSGEDPLEDGYTTLNIVGLSCLGVGLSLFFIIGFICLFFYQRNRIGHYNFSAKPEKENFSYLVFNA
ncbi:uromodulin-like 1 isoform X1 [Etheostoma spectabile]|uniref:uromodulin-like 1 isoform X1 n=1 Tax=Etheostoma spectabile TaxID=54343 RepID=UPI0013AF2D2C|nr:uromodulin-like 1 isoform X1 [Etheostoma spectabile]